MPEVDVQRSAASDQPLPRIFKNPVDLKNVTVSHRLERSGEVRGCDATDAVQINKRTDRYASRCATFSKFQTADSVIRQFSYLNRVIRISFDECRPCRLGVAFGFVEQVFRGRSPLVVEDDEEASRIYAGMSLR